MKKPLLRVTAVQIVLASLVFSAGPAQSKTATPKQPSVWHCQRFVGKAKAKGGGTDYRFAATDNRYFVTYHIEPGGSPPDPLCLNAVAAPFVNQIQSGYFAATSTHYTEEQNYWNSPQHFYDSICHANQSLAAWGGIQNSTGTTLIQTGMVRYTINSSVFSGAFYEIVGGPSQTGTKKGVGSMVVLTNNTLPYDQSHKFYFHVYLYGSSLIRFQVMDGSTSIGFASVTIPGGNAQYAGNRADAVQERVSYLLSTGNYHATKYEDITGSQGGGSDLFSAVQARVNGAWVNFNTQPEIQLIMHDNTTNTNLDTPSAISSQDTFTTNRGTACGTDELTY